MTFRTCEDRDFPRRLTRRRWPQGRHGPCSTTAHPIAGAGPIKPGEKEEKGNAEASETGAEKRGWVHVDGTDRRRLDRRHPGRGRRAAVFGLCARLAARRGEGDGRRGVDGRAGLCAE